MAWAILNSIAMETRLKERLTGAAILVALIVMLVPEMFRGQGGGDATSASSGAGDGPPVRSYTIDLSNNPSHNTPLQSTPATTVPVAAPASSSLPQAAEAADSANSAKASAAPVPSATRVAHATAAAPAAAAKAAPAGGWSVQVGIFSKRENAERMMHEVQGKGFNVGVSGADNKGLFHVRAVGLPDRAAAQTLAQRLKAGGFAATVVAPP